MVRWRQNGSGMVEGSSSRLELSEFIFYTETPRPRSSQSSARPSSLEPGWRTRARPALRQWRRARRGHTLPRTIHLHGGEAGVQPRTRKPGILVTFGTRREISLDTDLGHSAARGHKEALEDGTSRGPVFVVRAMRRVKLQTTEGSDLCVRALYVAKRQEREVLGINQTWDGFVTQTDSFSRRQTADAASTSESSMRMLPEGKKCLPSQ